MTSKTEHKICSLYARVCEQDHAAVHAAAKSLDLGFAEYIRRCVLKDKYMPKGKELPTVPPELTRQLAAIGNLLNQVAKGIHKSADPSAALVHLELAKIHGELEALRSQYDQQAVYP